MKPDQLFIGKVLKARLSGNGAQLPNDPEGAKLYPQLWAWLTQVDAGDEFQKEPARLSIQLGLGVWEVGIQDVSLKVGVNCPAPTLNDAYGCMERELASGQARVQVWKGKSLELRKRRKEGS